MEGQEEGEAGREADSDRWAEGERGEGCRKEGSFIYNQAFINLAQGSVVAALVVTRQIDRQTGRQVVR